jgi:hypothetical protein
MSLSNIAPRGVWGVGRRAFSEVGRSPTDKTTTHVPPHATLLPTHQSPSFSPSLWSPSLVTQSLWSPTATTPSPCHFIPRSGSRSLTTRTRSCGRVVKDAKRSAGEGSGTTQPQCQSHKHGGGPVAKPAPGTTPPATGTATLGEFASQRKDLCATTLVALCGSLPQSMRGPVWTRSATN